LTMRAERMYAEGMSMLIVSCALVEGRG
jgi:hypothetical protein